MAEVGCLKDGHFQNLQVESNLILGSGASSIVLNSPVVTYSTRKMQSFAGSLAATNGASVAYAASGTDVLVEIGTLDTTIPSGLVAGTKFFIHKVLVGITTAAGTTLVGNLKLSPTSGTATNETISSPTEICGAGVTSFNDQTSAAESTLSEVDINFNDTAGNYHIFVPNVTAPIASTNLYACTKTALSTDATAGRFTVEIEYSVF